MFFFFKQKTAYEMRISDWSSDVCSSDLPELARLFTSLVEPHLDVIDVGANIGLFTVLAGKRLGTGRVLAAEPTDGAFSRLTANVKNNRSEERRVGKECVSTCRSRLSRSH